MDLHHKSLLSYLTTKNPVLDVRNSCKGSNTASYKQSWKEPEQIQKWNDFQFSSLASIYDGKLAQILEKDVQCPTPIDISPVPFREIHDENSLEVLLALWTHQLVSTALKITQDNLDLTGTSDKIYMVRGGQAENLYSHPKNAKRCHSRPDWAGVKKKTGLSQKMKHKASNILPGDTKISSKWKSSQVQFGKRENFKDRPDSIRPVMQVFNYCLRANARYGYIITDRELVVLRVRAVADKTEQAHSQGAFDSQGSQEVYASEAQRQARKSGEVELLSIPWANHVDQSKMVAPQMTVNLALWWLHLMASVESCIDKEYPELSDEKFPGMRTSSNGDFATDAQVIQLQDVGFTGAVERMALTPAASFSYPKDTVSTGRKRKQHDTEILPKKIPGGRLFESRQTA